MRKQKDGFDRDDQVSQGTVASQHRATGPMTCDFFCSSSVVLLWWLCSLRPYRLWRPVLGRTTFFIH